MGILERWSASGTFRTWGAKLTMSDHEGKANLALTSQDV
jgi:hypothetical protein